jgi:hypothetical protein
MDTPEEIEIYLAAHPDPTLIDVVGALRLTGRWLGGDEAKLRQVLLMLIYAGSFTSEIAALALSEFAFDLTSDGP